MAQPVSLHHSSPLSRLFPAAAATAGLDAFRRPLYYRCSLSPIICLLFYRSSTAFSLDSTFLYDGVVAWIGSQRVCCCASCVLVWCRSVEVGLFPFFLFSLFQCLGRALVMAAAFGDDAKADVRFDSNVAVRVVKGAQRCGRGGREAGWG